MGVATIVSSTIGATTTGIEKMALESKEWVRAPASPQG
jgi:hypothetical protein